MGEPSTCWSSALCISRFRRQSCPLGAPGTSPSLSPFQHFLPSTQPCTFSCPESEERISKELFSECFSVSPDHPAGRDYHGCCFLRSLSGSSLSTTTTSPAALLESVQGREVVSGMTCLMDGPPHPGTWFGCLLLCRIGVSTQCSALRPTVAFWTGLHEVWNVQMHRWEIARTVSQEHRLVSTYLPKFVPLSIQNSHFCTPCRNQI